MYLLAKKRSKDREIAMSSFFPTLFGVSEPAIFAVNIKGLHDSLYLRHHRRWNRRRCDETGRERIGFALTGLPGLTIVYPPVLAGYIIGNLAAFALPIVFILVCAKAGKLGNKNSRNRRIKQKGGTIMELKNFDKYTAISREHIPYLRDLAAAVSQSPYRPVVHICPPCGLLNDPNGLCWYEGWYHVFYQWYPLGASHGMSTGPCEIQGSVCREWCDEILIPSQPYENGCYSGNAFVSPEDGNCYLFYTANYKTEKGRIPKQAAAIMKPDGTISKCSRNPLIDGAPSGMGGDIRDPFVFEQNGRYYMMLGATDQKGKGQLILYSGSTLLEWDYLGIVRLQKRERN